MKYLTTNSAFVYEGPLYEVRLEDGPGYYFDYFVAVEVEDKTFTHERGFTHRDIEAAHELARRVDERGVIDVAHWFEGSAWDGVRAEINEANRLAAMGATEADLEALGLA